MFLHFSAPKTPTKTKQSRLLRTVARDGPIRDVAFWSRTLGAGLRLRELVGLNVGDVAPDGRQVGWRVSLIPSSRRENVAAWPFYRRASERRCAAI